MKTKLGHLLSRVGPEDRNLLVRYIHEADFFWKFLHPLLAQSHPARVLEVGSGIGLLSFFAGTQGATVTSLEPQSSGFDKMMTFRNMILESWTDDAVPDFKDCYLHELSDPANFDFIYCINVLEHVPEPEALISEMYDRLRPGGTVWCVLPNYSFPYEQHFEIPILINKTITGSVFRKRIRNHPVSPDAEGLWSELSWPSQKRLKKFLSSTGWDHRFKSEVLAGYFERLSEAQFVARKGFFYKIFRPLIKMLKPVILRFPHQIQPVIEFTVSKPSLEPLFSKGSS